MSAFLASKHTGLTIIAVCKCL